jgi:hypothetical protein
MSSRVRAQVDWETLPDFALVFSKPTMKVDTVHNHVGRPWLIGELLHEHAATPKTLMDLPDVCLWIMSPFCNALVGPDCLVPEGEHCMC